MNFGAIVRRIRRCESEAPAQLVLEHAIREAIQQEREACANVCKAQIHKLYDDDTLRFKEPVEIVNALALCEAVIRARSNA